MANKLALSTAQRLQLFLTPLQVQTTIPVVRKIGGLDSDTPLEVGMLQEVDPWMDGTTRYTVLCCDWRVIAAEMSLSDVIMKRENFPTLLELVEAGWVPEQCDTL